VVTPVDVDADDGQVTEGKRSPAWLTTDRKIAALLFVGVLAVYVALTRGTYYAYDAQAMLAVTRNIVDHGSIRTTGVGFVDSFHQSTPYSPYGIAMSLLGVPPYALSKAIGSGPLLVSMVNPVLMSFAVVLVYKTGRALGWRPVHGLTAAIGFGLFTQALQATMEFFSEPGVTLCVIAMVYGIVQWAREDRWAPLWVGLAAAAAVLFRSDSIFTGWVGLLAVPLFVPWRKLLNARALLLSGVPMALSLAFLIWYNEFRYHKVFATYGGSFTTPLGFGLHGLLLDPGKSIFVFNSLALLGVVGIGVLLKRNFPLAALFLLLIVPRTIFFAKWSSWEGGWAWGPRFLLPAVPLLILAAVELLRIWDRRSVAGIVTRAIAAVLAVFSLFVNFLSIRVPYQQWLQVLATPATLHKLGIPPLSAAAQFSDYNNDSSLGPIWGDVRLLQHHLALMGPDWWAHGRPIVGILLLVVAGGCLAWTAFLARNGPDEMGTPAEHGEELATQEASTHMDLALQGGEGARAHQPRSAG
jgi:hypothetical protein